jgi:hypothetical protein
MDSRSRRLPCCAIGRRQALLQRLWSGFLFKCLVTEALKETLAAEPADRRWRNVSPLSAREQMLQTRLHIAFFPIEAQRHLVNDCWKASR